MNSSRAAKLRFNIAIVMVALYALSILAPSMGLAFADPSASAHCLTEPSGFTHEHLVEQAQAHEHAPTHDGHDSGGTHRDADKSQPRCCGLSGVTALAGEASVVLANPSQAGFGHPPVDAGFADRSPDRIIRPPIV